MRLHSELPDRRRLRIVSNAIAGRAEGSLAANRRRRGGVLLYLRPEGPHRPCQQAARLCAQDRGLDTIEANLRLGFADDERGYGVAAAMLRALGVDEVRLLTNNPAKLAGLEAAGIRVIERVAHHMPVNPHNADYVATKKAKSGHLD